MQLSLPTSTSVSMEYEVSRDEAEAHGKQLADAGVPTEVIRFAGLVHGVYWISGAVPAQPKYVARPPNSSRPSSAIPKFSSQILRGNQ